MKDTNEGIIERWIPFLDSEIYAKGWLTESTAPPLLLLHDSLGSVELWRDFPERLRDRLGRSIYAYDRLGFGRSSARDKRPSLDFIAEEADTILPAVIQALGLESFILLGHSVGGAMALTYAGRTRSSCQAVVSIAAQSFVEKRTLQGIVRAEEGLRDLSRLARYHGEKAAWVLDAWTKVWLDPAFSSWKLDEGFSSIDCPLLIIHGESDEYGSRAFPERIQALAGSWAEMHILEDCGHVPQREKAEEVMALIEAFVAKAS